MIWKLCQTKTLEQELQTINDDNDDEISKDDHERYSRSANPDYYISYHYRYGSSYRAPLSTMASWKIALIYIGGIGGFVILVVLFCYCLYKH